MSPSRLAGTAALTAIVLLSQPALGQRLVSVDSLSLRHRLSANERITDERNAGIPRPAIRTMHIFSVAPDTAKSPQRGTYSDFGLVVGAVVGGAILAAQCSRDDCYVPIIPIAVGALVGGAVGALIGVFVDR